MTDEERRAQAATDLIAIQAAFIAFTRGVERVIPGAIDAAREELEGIIMRSDPPGDGSVFLEAYGKARSLLTKPVL